MKLKKLFTAGWRGDVIALLSGALLTLAFAPFMLFPLAIILPGILLLTWLYVTHQQAFWRGWLFGLGLFSTGVYWVFISIHTYGNASFFLASFITISLIAILALFPALSGYVLNRYFPKVNDAKIIFAFPIIWVLFEWVRSWIFTGFPWLTLGYSQSNSPLHGYAALFGIYAISLAVLVSASLLLTLIMQWRARKKKPRGLLNYVAVLMLIWLAGFGFTFLTWTKPSGKPIQVSMVQGNIPQQVKWTPSALFPTLRRYTSLTNNHWDSSMIIWPEGAIPLPLQAAENFINALDAEAKKHHAAILTGIPVRAGGSENYYNTVIAIGEGSGVYLKQRLVPFGEFTPFGNIVKRLLTSLDIPMSDFISGPKMPDAITVHGIKISTFICYEIAFPELVVNREADVGMILTVSDDAWFGHSIAQAQHLQIAQLRAMEMARPVLFVSNNGLTAAIDAKGKITAIAPPFQPYVLTAEVQPRTGLTLWQLGTTDPVFMIMLLMLAVAIKRKYN